MAEGGSWPIVPASKVRNPEEKLEAMAEDGSWPIVPDSKVRNPEEKSDENEESGDDVRLDIIAALMQRCPFVVKKIFGYLDYFTLFRAYQVSTKWRDAMSTLGFHPGNNLLKRWNSHKYQTHVLLENVQYKYDHDCVYADMEEIFIVYWEKDHMESRSVEHRLLVFKRTSLEVVYHGPFQDFDTVIFSFLGCNTFMYCLACDYEFRFFHRSTHEMYCKTNSQTADSLKSDALVADEGRIYAYDKRTRSLTYFDSRRSEGSRHWRRFYSLRDGRHGDLVDHQFFNCERGNRYMTIFDAAKLTSWGYTGGDLAKIWTFSPKRQRPEILWSLVLNPHAPRFLYSKGYLHYLSRNGNVLFSHDFVSRVSYSQDVKPRYSPCFLHKWFMVFDRYIIESVGRTTQSLCFVENVGIKSCSIELEREGGRRRDRTLESPEEHDFRDFSNMRTFVEGLRGDIKYVDEMGIIVQSNDRICLVDFTGITPAKRDAPPSYPSIKPH